AKGEEEADAPLRLQAAQLLHQQVFLAYLTIAISLVGQLAFGTFQVAILTDITHIDPFVAVPIYLLIGGAGSVVGIWVGGKLADWSAAAAIVMVLIGQIVCFSIMLLAVHNAIAMAIMLFFSAAFGFGFSTPIQVRVLSGAKQAPRLAATLIATAYNIGIAGGAAVGAWLISIGFSYALLPATGIICSALALAAATTSIQLSRRGVA
ncbi:MAG: hypothetical protein ABIQ30_09650, partial [Devosia sp.]